MLNHNALDIIKQELTHICELSTKNRNKVEMMETHEATRARYLEDVNRLKSKIEEQDILIENLIAEMQAIRQELGMLPKSKDYTTGCQRM
jgi:predicted RNase H-like nuclease (RuvC/YqgF family)